MVTITMTMMMIMVPMMMIVVPMIRQLVQFLPALRGWLITASWAESFNYFALPWRFNTMCSVLCACRQLSMSAASVTLPDSSPWEPQDAPPAPSTQVTCCIYFFLLLNKIYFPLKSPAFPSSQQNLLFANFLNIGSRHVLRWCCSGNPTDDL